MGRYQLPRGFPRPTSNVRTQVADATRPLYPSDNSPGWVRFAEQGWVRSAERYRNNGLQPTASSLIGTAAVVAHCTLAGVEMVRVHDVRPMRQVVDMCRPLALPPRDESNTLLKR